MRALLVLVAAVSMTVLSFGQTAEYTYRFSDYKIQDHGDFQTIVFNNTQQYGVTGEPTLPYMQVSLLLPPGESVSSVEFIPQNEVVISGTFNLPPVQPDYPYSAGSIGASVKKETVYASSEIYPKHPASTLVTQYLNGYSFALGKFTPVRWNPVTGALSYFTSVKIVVHSARSAASEEALKNLSSTDDVLLRVRTLAQNDAMMDLYPTKQPLDVYQYLIITTAALKPYFEPLKNYYDSIGVSTRIATSDSIASVMPGSGTRTKIRNYIIQEYQNSSIGYVMLGGDVSKIGARGFYCYVISGAGYEDDNIPADLYFSGLDGTFDADNDGIYGEALTDSVDLLPEVAIGRYPVDDATEISNMVTKTINYQKYPVMGDMNKILMLGELLLDTPLTLGQDYLKLLIDNHSDNGYTTSGIPSATNTIDTLYDQWNQAFGYADEWSQTEMIDQINQGYSFIHHVGHSSEEYMMRMYISDFDETTFAPLNGTSHSYGLVYSHGCMCGSFDWDDCIAEKSVLMNDYLVACIVNSRYGWFNEGQTEGPSQHLHREFINAIYNPTINERNLGNAFIMSKIATAPWVDLAGEYEFGAQRWVHYDNNLLGDPALRLWVNAIETGVADNEPGSLSVYPNPAEEVLSVGSGYDGAQISMFNTLGEVVLSGIVSETTINIGTLPAGVYLLKVNLNGVVSSAKVLVR